MATTVGAFSAIDDSEVDSESPITESLVTRLRDNSYWIDQAQTTETDTTLVLKPDGSGGTNWSGTIVDGTTGVVINASTTWATITSKTAGILLLDWGQHAGGGASQNCAWASVKVNLGTDAFVSSYTYLTSGTGAASYASGTITTGQTVGFNQAGFTIQLRRNAGNLQVYASTGTPTALHASWVVL